MHYVLVKTYGKCVIHEILKLQRLECVANVKYFVSCGIRCISFQTHLVRTFYRCFCNVLLSPFFDLAKKLGLKTIRVFLEGFYDEGEGTIGSFSVKRSKDILEIVL